jgi:hypothetical protein
MLRIINMVGKHPVIAAKFAVTTKTFFFFMVINSICYHISTANGELSLTCCIVILLIISLSENKNGRASHGVNLQDHIQPSTIQITC